MCVVQGLVQGWQISIASMSFPEGGDLDASRLKSESLINTILTTKTGNTVPPD